MNFFTTKDQLPNEPLPLEKRFFSMDDPNMEFNTQIPESDEINI